MSIVDIKEQLRNEEVLKGLCILSVHCVENDMDDDLDLYIVNASEQYHTGDSKVYVFQVHSTGEIGYMGVSGGDLVDEPYWNR